MSETPNNRPLSGIRVIELAHVVMGSSCGMILGDMGAEVIKIERVPDGDATRRLPGFGLGLFHYFNRNKRSLALDLKSEEGKAILKKAITSADVFLENFAPGAVERLGFGYEACAKFNPRLVYCSLKGFMPGPYENRPSLDNLVQMMGGLAYMTGPKGRPLRAGASVMDIIGGTFGALGIISALYDRRATGRGRKVLSTLFEATAFMVGQHMAGGAIGGTPLPPMPEGDDPWSVYDLFDTSDGEQVFIGLTSDAHWKRFCDAFALDKLLADQRLRTNVQRVEHRGWMIPELQKELGQLSRDKICALSEKAAIPFSPVGKPEDLFDDPHLNQGGGLLETTLPNGEKAKLPKLPLRLDGADFDLRLEAPRVGEGGGAYLESIGYTKSEIDKLVESGVVVGKCSKA